MAIEHSIRRYRNWYGKLIRLYPKPYRERFGEGMEQTFNDLCRERRNVEKGLFRFALGIFIETSAGIVRENTAFILMRYKNIIRIALAVACLLLVPLLGKFPWDLFDFVVAGTLLFGTGLTYELIARKGGTLAYRVAVGMAVGAALILVWINLAVGLIGNENNPANLMYGGVLAVGAVGAILARLQPLGMSRALFAMAIAQALVPVLALISWRPSLTMGVLGVFVLNGFFVMLFAGSGLLFRQANRRVQPIS